MKVTFKEEQSFMTTWVGWFLIALFFIPVYGLYKQFFLGEPFGDNPLSDEGMIFMSIFIFGLIAFIVLIKLKTEINEFEIKMRFFPLTSKTIQWSDIKSAKVVNYGFVGGWGIRLWTKYGTVYNISGNKGLAIKLHNGNTFLIGTQKEVELQSFIDSLKLKREY